MIQHVVLLQWQPGTSAEAIAAIGAAFARLPALIPEIRSYRFGPDLGLNPQGNADYALVAEFANAADFSAYALHPHHIEVMQAAIGDRLAAWQAVQFQL